MRPEQLEWSKEIVAYAIYQRWPQGSPDADWFAGERLIAQNPIQLQPNPGNISKESFRRRYGDAVYFHAMNYIFFLYEGDLSEDTPIGAEHGSQTTFLRNIRRLHNRYFVMRHGESRPNVQGIILSDFYTAQLNAYSLTKEGERQVRASTEIAKTCGALDHETIIIASPLSRCRRTAEIVAETLETSIQPLSDERLRERWFGKFEQTSTANYEHVWRNDRINPAHADADVESAICVQERGASLIRELEFRFRQKTILLISHGDTLQILQTGFARRSPATHRELKHLEEAEIRQLHLTNPS
jgi:probable phosphoglycerate mutase